MKTQHYYQLAVVALVLTCLWLSVRPVPNQHKTTVIVAECPGCGSMFMCENQILDKGSLGGWP